MATEPSIALIPSGYKTSNIFSVLPSNGDGDLNFSRSGIANRINKEELIEEMSNNMPRLDYSDNGCPSLLLEPQSTNLITYPLSFGNNYWTKIGATVVSGFPAPSVNNPLGAFKLVEDTSNGAHYLTTLIPFSSGTSYSLSFFVKKLGSRTTIKIQAGNPATWSADSIFDLSTGTVVSSNYGTGTIELIGNDYYKCTISGLANATASTGVVVFLYNNSTSYTGDGTSGAYIFGAQLEQQPYATSLMLPNTEGQQATRLAETASKTGLENYINSSEGVLYAEVELFENNGIDSIISLYGSAADNIYITFNGDTLSSQIVYEISNSIAYNKTVNITKHSKISVSWSGTKWVIFINGVKIDETVAYNSFSAGVLNSIYYAYLNNLSNNFHGKVNDFRVYETALSDAELTTLTTL